MPAMQTPYVYQRTALKRVVRRLLMHIRQGACRAAWIVCLVLLVLSSACASASTIDWVNYVISEDVMYWYHDAETQKVSWTMNWSEIQGNDVPLVKVQQTVYNQEYTALLKEWHTIPVELDGYLYAYSVSNLNVLERIPDPGKPGMFINSGIKEFHVNWALPAITVTTSVETPDTWDPFYLSTGPTWMYRGNGPGMLPGETIGGFWAFADTGNDGLTPARIKAGTNGSIEFWGMTTGPAVLPEPGGVAVLLSGMAGMLGYVVKTRRK